MNKKYWFSSIVYQLTILVFQYCFLKDSGKPVLLVHNTGYPALYKVQSIQNRGSEFSETIIVNLHNTMDQQSGV